MVKYYKGTDFSIVAKTPEIAVTDEINVQAGSSFYNNEIASVSIGTKSSEWKTVFDKFKTNRESAIGGSVAVSYTNDTMSAKVDTDLGYAIKAYEVTGKEEATGIVEKKDTEKYCMDLVANFTMDPLSVDAYYKYYGTKKNAVDANYLSLQVATDLNTFDVPVNVELTGKDLLATTDHSVKATVTEIENLELTVSDGYVLNTIGRDAKLMYLFNNLTEKTICRSVECKSRF